MVQRKIKVMHLINSFSLGGAEKLVFDLAPAMDRERFEVFVCAMASRGDRIEESIRSGLEKSGIRTISLKKKARRDRIKAIWKLFRILRCNGIDILHTHCPSPDFYGKITASLARTPRVFSTIHNTRGYTPLLERFLNPLTTRYIAISETVRRYMIERLKIPTKKITVIYNAIDVNAFRKLDIDRKAKLKELGLPSNSSVITAIGRITHQKGHIYLVEAAEITLQAFSDVYFLIVGDDTVDPEVTKAVRKAIRTKGLEGRVILTGVRMDVPEILAITDVFVLPSLWEGLSIVLLEAMAAGVPVVVTDVGSNAEVVEDGVSGFVVPPKNPSLLAQRIQELLTNPQRAAEMAEAARRRINERFSLERLAQEHESLYLDALRGTGARVVA